MSTKYLRTKSHIIFMANKRLGGQRKKEMAREVVEWGRVGGKAIRILNLMYAANCA